MSQKVLELSEIMAEKHPFKRGSEWRKWDLHVHTPASLVHHYGGNDDVAWESFISDLENLPTEFSVIGINDYLFIDGYKKVLEYKRNGRLSNIDTIFPVVEFRIKKFGGHASFKRINFHVIFSNELDPQVIEQQFLNQLYGQYQLASGFEGIDWKGVVTPASLADLGTKIKASVPADKLADYGSDIEEGFNNINFNEDELVELLKTSTYLKNHFLTAIGKTEWDAFNWGDNSIAEKKTVINSVDIIFTASENIDAFKNAKHKLTEQGVNDFLLDCSDAHSLSTATVKDRIGQCFTWVKSDPTFAGLKLLKYESDRVKIQDRNPDDSKPSRIVIDRVDYKNSADVNEVVLLNKDLNSIIGVRGSGKSTLIKSIAFKVDPNQFKEKDSKPPYQLKDFKVVWSDDQEDIGTDESPKSIFYVPQNYLSSLAYDDGDHVSERDGFLTKLLKKNVKFANAIEAFESFASQNKIRIEEVIEKLLKVDSLVKENESLLRRQGSSAEIDKEITQKNEDIKKYKSTVGSGITDKEISDYSQAQSEVLSNKKAMDILTQDEGILASLKETGASIFISDQQFNLLSPARQELIRSELNKMSREDLVTLIDVEIVKIMAQVEQLTTDTQAKQATLASLSEKIKQSKALEDLTKELGSLRETQAKIKELAEKLAQAQIERDTAIEYLAAAYQDFDLQQAAIYKTVEFEEEFSFLKVVVVAKYNTTQIKNFVERNINTRDSEPQLKQEEDIKILFAESPVKLSSETIVKVIKGLLDGRLKIKVEADNVGNVISLLLRNRFEIDYLNSVKTRDGETCFKDMTGGQKAIALLELIFRFDDEKYPILIDQPEDDLDVGGVATDLVNFIKAEKEDRQIIIVSHNASLVVCSDSEEIIVSNIQHLGAGKHDFTYSTGAIENHERRDDIIRILEGGDGALKKRMQKLNVR